MLKKTISEKITQSDSFPENLMLPEGEVQLEYTINNQLQNQVRALVDSYRPDYAVVVVLDNATGHVISALGYRGSTRTVDQSLIFNSQNPAASIFKIVTAASLLEKEEIDVDTEVRVKGKGTTLYKYQLMDYDNQRWTRSISLNKAFALSNNVAFGKLAIKKLASMNIDNSAEKFYFNRDLMSDIEIPHSNYRSPSSQYNMAEVASGFNRSTTLNPIHAAFLASVISNGGEANFPRLLSLIRVNGNDWVSDVVGKQKIIDSEVASSIEEMMTETVDTGTARKSFRQFMRKYRDRLIVGGKTGSITGGEPNGKRDWFVAFSREKFSTDKGISLSVMLVNQKKWKVKSSFLASRIIDFYYKDLPRQGKILTKLN